MRVISGKAKGTNLKAVPGDGTRPILQRVKTSLFDIVRPRLQDATILDAFAGSGGVGIEALSQGAAMCVFLDTNKAAVATIKENLESTKLAGQAYVRSTDAFRYVRDAKKSFDIIYVAPPQYQGLWVEMIRTIAERPHIVKPGGDVIVQIDPKEDEEDLGLKTLKEYRRVRHGKTLLIFYQHADQAA